MKDIKTFFNSESLVKEKPQRKPKELEDSIISMVYARLQAELKFTDVEVQEWIINNGKRFPRSCIGDLRNGASISYLSRIPVLAEYFQEVHKLDYVTCDYLLMGTEVERKAIEEKKQLLKAAQENMKRILLPLEEAIENARVS